MLLQLDDALTAASQPIQFVFQFCVQLRQALGHHPVLARHVVNLLQPFLYLGQAFRVYRHRINIGLNFAPGLLELDGGGVEQLPGVLHRLACMALTLQQLESLPGAASVTLAEFQRLVRAVQYRFGVGQPLLLLFQISQFGLAQCELVQFVHLVAQQLRACGLFVAGTGEQFKLAPGPQPVGSRLLHVPRQRLVPGEGIEQQALHRFAQQ